MSNRPEQTMSYSDLENRLLREKSSNRGQSFIRFTYYFKVQRKNV